MFFRFSAIIVLFAAFAVVGQTVRQPASVDLPDDLSRHLSAAQTYQLTGDLPRAELENKAVVAIALRRAGLLALDNSDFNGAAKSLGRSLEMFDDSLTRASLAGAYMRLGQEDRALEEARRALVTEPRNVRALQIVSGISYTRGDFKSALPALESMLQIAPDFDGAYLLGLTYLHLKQPERARLLFEEIENALQKKRANLHLMFGRAYDETDYPADAERSYRRVTELDPKEPKANFYLGFVILTHGGSERLPEARAAFERELALSPNDPFTLFFLGVVATSLNENEKAVEFLKRSIALKGDMGQSYLFLGQAQGETGDIVNAEKNLRRAIALTKDEAKEDFQIRRAHFLLGRLLIRAGRREEGEKELATAREIQNRMFERDKNEIGKILGLVVAAQEKNNAQPAAALTAQKTPSSKQTPAQKAELEQTKSKLFEIAGQAYHNLGVISVQKGMMTDALAQFTAATELSPKLPGLDRNFGIVCFRNAEFEKAIAPLARHLKLTPSDTLVRRMLGVSQYLTRRFTDAVATLKPLGPALLDDSELAYFYGISLVQNELNRDAETHFSNLAARYPSDAQARFYAAQGFAIAGNFERAVKEFRAVTVIVPAMPRVHYNAGQSLIRLNRFDEAANEFRAELQISPNDELSKYHLAFSLIQQKVSGDEAEQLLRDAILLKSDYADAHYQLGKLLIERGLAEDAVKHLETAAKAEPKVDYIRYQLSIAYRKLARTADADRELNLYRELKAANRQVTAPMGQK